MSAEVLLWRGASWTSPGMAPNPFSACEFLFFQHHLDGVTWNPWATVF